MLSEAPVMLALPFFPSRELNEQLGSVETKPEMALAGLDRVIAARVNLHDDTTSLSRFDRSSLAWALKLPR